MKIKSFFVAILAILAIAAITFSATSCNRRPQEVQKLNPIRDVPPVDTTWWAGSSITTESGVVIESGCFPLEQFHELGDRGDTAAQHQLFNEHLRDLTINVKSHYPEIATHDNVHFFLATGHASNVESGNGNHYSGDIRNELLIVIKDPRINKTLFLACGNGMLSDANMNDFQYCVDWGPALPWLITIKEGESLALYWKDLDVWANLAEQLGIPIVNSKGELVPYSVYRNYLDKYISLVWPGDVINLLELTAKDKNGNIIDNTEAQRRYNNYKRQNTPRSSRGGTRRK